MAPVARNVDRRLPKRKNAEEVRRTVVTALAEFHSPSEVVEIVKGDLGVDVSRQFVQRYDPNRAGEKPAKRWRDLYDQTRARAVDGLNRIGGWHKAIRVARLDEMAKIAQKKGNFRLARELLEQIAREEGNWYTNTRKLVGGKPEDGDAPIAHEFVFRPYVPPPIGVRTLPGEGEMPPVQALAAHARHNAAEVIFETVVEDDR